MSYRPGGHSSSSNGELMEEQLNVPLKDIWKHVGTIEARQAMDAAPLPKAEDYLKDHARALAQKALEPVIHDLSVKIFMGIMDTYSASKSNEPIKPDDAFKSLGYTPRIKVDVKLPMTLPGWVCEMAYLETQIIPEHLLSFKDDGESED